MDTDNNAMNPEETKPEGDMAPTPEATPAEGGEMKPEGDTAPAESGDGSSAM